MNWGRENFSNFYRQLSASKPVILIAIISLFLIPVVTSVSGENMTEPEYDTDEEVYMVSNLTELNWIRNAPKEDYKLVDDINATETKNWNNGDGWKPIGEQNYEFHGTLNGNGKKIRGLTINRTSNSRIGLIGYSGDNALITDIQIIDFNLTSYRTIGSLTGINHGEISRVSVNNSSIEAKGNYGFGENVGGIVGINHGTIYEVDFDGKLLGGGELGGITGINEESINEAYAELNFSSNSKSQIGGITGINDGQIENSQTEINFTGGISYIGGIAGDQRDGKILNSTSKGSINVSEHNVGGIVGQSENGRISKTKSKVDIQGTTEVGGIAGENKGSLVFSSYDGKIRGDEYVGGVTGINTGDEYDEYVIRNSYSKGSVHGNKSVGGLVGYNDDGGRISKSYSTGNVTGETYAGGLVGWNVGTIKQSYWDTKTSGLEGSDGGEGLNTSQMKSFWSYRSSPDISAEYFEEGEPQALELKQDNVTNISLNAEDNTFELLKANNSGEDEAIVKLNGVNRTLTESQNITVSGVDIGLSYADEEYNSSYYGYEPAEARLEFYVEKMWDLKNISSLEDDNQSYTWNIVDGRSYPFLSWEKVEEGNYSTTIEVKNKSGEPIENASVNIDGIIKETGPNGIAYFESLYNTQYVASVYADDYREKLINFELSDEDQTEAVELQEYNSTFNFSISSINYTDEGDYWSVDSNVTVQNVGDEPGKRRLVIATAGSGEEKNVSLDSGESTNVSFETELFSEGSYESQIFRYNQPDSGILVANKTFEIREEEDDTKEYQLSIKDSKGGSIAGSPGYGNTSYDKGEYVYLLARPYEAWDFESWTGDIRRDSKGIYVHMDQDLEVKPNFSRSVAIDFQTYIFPSVAKEEGESIAFNFTINNTREENITEELNVKLGDRKIRNLSKSIEVNSTGLYTSDNSSKAFEFNITKGDAAKVKDLSIEYGGAVSTKSYRIGAIERKFVDGFNYFSIPAVTDDKYSLDNIFTNNKLRDVDTSISDKIESIWTYREGKWKNYHPSAPSNDFNTLEAGQGYIVDAKENFTVYPAVDTNLSRVDSDSLVLPAENDISSGWNLIGSYWTDPKYSNQTGAFNSMPEDHITEVLYSDRNGEIGLKKLRGGDIKSGRAYWISAKSNASYTKSR